MPLRLFVLMFLRGASFGAIGPFAGVLALGAGVPSGLLGPIAGAGAIVTLIAAPLWGGLGDRRGRRKILAVAFLLAGLAGAAHALSHDATIVTAIFAWSAASAAFIPLGDSLTLDRLAGDRARYSRVRIGATVGYCLANLAAGALAIGALGSAAPGILTLLLCLLTALVLAVRLANEARGRAVAEASIDEHADAGVEWAGAEGENPGDEAAGLGLLTRIRERARFLAGLAIVFAGANAPTVFVGAKLSELGGSLFDVGLSAAASAVVEIPAFLVLPLLLRRFGGRRMFIVGALIMSASSLASALAPFPALVIATRLAFGAGYAWMIVPSLAALAASAESGEGAAVQALHFGANAAGTLLAAMIGLPLAMLGGVSAIIAGAAIVAPLGALLATRRWPTARAA